MASWQCTIRRLLRPAVPGPVIPTYTREHLHRTVTGGPATVRRPLIHTKRLSSFRGLSLSIACSLGRWGHTGTLLRRASSETTSGPALAPGTRLPFVYYQHPTHGWSFQAGALTRYDPISIWEMDMGDRHVRSVFNEISIGSPPVVGMSIHRRVTRYPISI
jgi:hypothetical protein